MGFPRDNIYSMKRIFTVVLLSLLCLLCLSAGCITIQMPSDNQLFTTPTLTPTSTPTSSDVTSSIVGSWYAKEGDSGSITLELYKNGLGTGYYTYEKGAASADDYEGYNEAGYYGYIKSITFDLKYDEISKDNYLVTATSVYLEMYNGQTRYVSESEMSELVLGNLIYYNYNKIGWKSDDDSITILNRI